MEYDFIPVTMIRGTIVDEDEQEVEQTHEAYVRASDVRSYYARRNGAPGTRLTFRNGGGWAVTQSVVEIQDLLRSAGAQ